MLKTIDEVKSSYMNYDYALVYEFSDVKFGKTSETVINWEECMEAFLIKNDEQMHVFERNGRLVAESFLETEQKYDSADKIYKIRGGVDLSGKNITVREYLDTDEDGQAFVKYSRIISVN